MKRFTVILALSVFVFSGLFAQTIHLTGTVTSADDGVALPGVSVVVKGTTIGTATNVDGVYELDVPENATELIFSFVGMRTVEVAIAGNTTVDAVLALDYLGLDEVIVTGVAGETPRRKLAVSVEKVSADEIKEVTAGSAASALQGKVSGVTVIRPSGEPGTASTILVRGATQISGSQAPLIILDGAILEGTMADINVDDIESMEVVKGASAAALYGSRAGNGVIAITTRRGTGITKGRTEVVLRNEYGINSLAKKYDLSTHHAYVLADDQGSFDFTKYDGVTYPADYEGTEGGYSGARYLEDDQYMDNEYAKIFDHEEDMFAGNAFYTNYLSVGSNMDRTNFLTSFENSVQSGLLIETDGYRRNSFRLNVDHRLTDNITLSASNLYIKSFTQDPGGDSKYNGGVFFDLLLTAPDVDFNQENPDGQPYLIVPNNWDNTTDSPVYLLYKRKDNNTRNRVLGTYSAKWRLTSFLNIEGKYAFESTGVDNNQYSPYDTWVRSGADPVYSQGSLSLYQSRLFSQNAQVTTNFNKRIGDFNTRARISYLYESVDFESNQTTGYDFTMGGVPSLDAVGGNINSTSYKRSVIAKNYFGILYLDYRDKYIFDGMARYDGSSLFGEDARWNPYYRVSGAWRISEDITIPGVQELKLRAAYGTAGQRPGFSAQYEVMSISSGTATKSQLGNKNLKPSLTTEVEVGLNVAFANRFDLEVVRAQSNTSNNIMTVPLAVQYGGWPSQIQNVGALEAKTWEATLGTQVVRRSDLTLNVNFIFDKIHAEITELPIPPFQTGPQGQEANKCFYIREGEVFGVMYGYSWVTSLDQMADQLAEEDDATTWYDETSISSYTVNSDGYVIVKGTEGTVYETPIKVQDEDGNDLFDKIGDTNPDFKLGMVTNLSYKGIGLYMLWSYKHHGDLYNKSAQWLTRDDRHGMMDQYDKPDNEKKTIPYYKEFYDVNSFNSFWVEDASYLKLRELSLSYSLPSSALSGFANGFIKDIKLAFIGRNLLTISQYSGYDPEVQTTNNTQWYAYDFMGYPNYRSFSASLEFKF